MKFLYPIALILSMAFCFGAQAQTINPPTINCVSTDETNGDVKIVYTPAALDPCGPFVSYSIFGSTSIGGPYLLVATITNPAQTQYIHAGANGTILDWFYYMTMEQNCPGSTSPQSATVSERLLEIPQIDYVTVVGNDVEVHWVPINPTSSTAEIEVKTLDKINAIYPTIDRVPASPPVYLDLLSDADAEYIVYVLQGFDLCNNQSINSDPSHNTVHITAAVNSCAQSVTITFNNYKGWDSDDDIEYLLEVTIDSDPPTYISLGKPFPDATPITQLPYDYDVAGLTGTNVTFRVAAVHPGGVKRSYSNAITKPLTVLQSTAFNYISFGSVTDSSDVQQIDFSWIIDTVADVESFVIQRSIDGVNFNSIDSLSADSNSVFERFYTDSSALVDDSSYYYRVLSRDICGFELASTVVHPIRLVAEGIESENRLTWNPFELENVSVLSYTIFRMDNDSIPIALETVLPSVQNYQEQIADVITENGIFCYMIEAECVLTLPDIDLPFRQFTTRSNVACADKEPVIWIPNAFVPNGVNTQFRPVLLFGVDQYDFRIYDRWGKELFVTNNVAHGWDGTFNGEKMPLGGYVYQLMITSAIGEKFERRGVVALIR